jgi:hypothetical protein
VAEIQEICVGSRTMSHEDYLECRAFDLTVSIFNNGGVVREFLRLAEALGVRRSAVIARIHASVRAEGGPLVVVYEELRSSEGRNFFATRSELEAFLCQPGTMDAYLRGEYGVNHIYRARSTALLQHFADVATLTRDAVAVELRARGLLDATVELYLDELLAVSIARKSHLTDLDHRVQMTVHFDFPGLHRVDYLADPRQALVPQGVCCTVAHGHAQRTDLRKYFTQYGRTVDGIGQFLQRNDTHLAAVLYRQVEYAEPFAGAGIRPSAHGADLPDLGSAPPVSTSVMPLRWLRR